MNSNRTNVDWRASGKCFDHGGKVGPPATGIHDGRQEGFGSGADAHANPSLFGQIDGKTKVLAGQCRREPTRVRRIEQTLQPKTAGKTHDRTVGQEAFQELVRNGVPSRSGNGLSERGTPVIKSKLARIFMIAPAPTGPQRV